MSRVVLFSVLFLCACPHAPEPTPCALPGPKVRRLTRAELDATLTEALGVKTTLAQSLAAEDLKLGYFGHDDLEVSSLFADQLDTASETLATERAAASTCNAGEAERDCARRILADLAPKAWRRPVSDAEVDELVALYDLGRDGEDHATGLALAMQAVFEATGSLYRTELGDDGTTLTQWEIASELSYLVTDGPPDAPLRDAAAAGRLSDPQVRLEHLHRLLLTPHAVRNLREFVEQWFGLTGMALVQKNNGFFPAYTAALRDDMAASMHHFVDATISGTQGSVSALLTADYTYADDALATYLGSSERPGPDLQRISTRDLPRRGLLTHPALLSVYAHSDDGSPVLRGKLVRTRLLCGDMPPPPPNVVAGVQPVSDTATTRERAEAHATSASCRVCHGLMDPIGFGLEGFDGFGAARSTESGKPIDDQGEITEADVPGPFQGGVELATRLASSQQVGRCAATQLVRYSLGHAETPADQCTVDLTYARYVASGGSLYAALEGIVESDAFTKRKVAP